MCFGKTYTNNNKKHCIRTEYCAVQGRIVYHRIVSFQCQKIKTTNNIFRAEWFKFQIKHLQIPYFVFQYVKYNSVKKNNLSAEII